jgi:hypothetical protein
MRRFKFALITLVIIVIPLLLVACGGGGEPTSAPPMETQPPADATQPPAVATEPSAMGGVIDTTSFQSGDQVYFTDFDGEGNLGDEWGLLPFPSDAEEYDVSLDGYSDLAFDITEAMDLLVLYDTDLLFFPRNQADVYVEASYENVGNNNLSMVSVVCRFSDEGFYMFGLMNGAKWYIYKYTFGKDWRKLLEGGVQNFNYDAPHTIGGSCVGDKLKLYVDGVNPPNAEYEESTFRDGGVGLGVSALDDNRETEIEVHDFTVSIP